MRTRYPPQLTLCKRATIINVYTSLWSRQPNFSVATVVSESQSSCDIVDYVTLELFKKTGYYA